MMRWLKSNIHTEIIAFFFLFLSLAFPACSQTKVQESSVYEIGETMINLILAEKQLSGANPAYIEGVRQGIEQSIAETELSLTFRNDGFIVFITGKDRQELEYKVNGLRVLVKRKDNGEFMDFGSFSKDKKKFTLMNRMILDKKE